MPYVKRRTRKISRRPIRRKTRTIRKRRSKAMSRPSRARLSRYIGGIADSTALKFTYACKVPFPDFNATTPGESSIVFNGDNLYDPGFNNDNHQVNKLVQWSAFYNKYIVYGSKIRVTIINQNDDNERFLALRALPADSIATGEDDIVTQAMTDPNIRYSILGTEFSSKGIRTLSMYRTTRKVLGLKSLNETLFSQNGGYAQWTTAGGTASWYWVASLSDLAESATSVSPNATALVKITYYAKLFDRKDVDMSTNT